MGLQLGPRPKKHKSQVLLFVENVLLDSKYHVMVQFEIQVICQANCHWCAPKFMTISSINLYVSSPNNIVASVRNHSLGLGPILSPIVRSIEGVLPTPKFIRSNPQCKPNLRNLSLFNPCQYILHTTPIITTSWVWRITLGSQHEDYTWTRLLDRTLYWLVPMHIRRQLRYWYFNWS